MGNFIRKQAITISALAFLAPMPSYAEISGSSEPTDIVGGLLSDEQVFQLDLASKAVPSRADESNPVRIAQGYRTRFSHCANAETGELVPSCDNEPRETPEIIRGSGNDNGKGMRGMGMGMGMGMDKDDRPE